MRHKTRKKEKHMQITKQLKTIIKTGKEIQKLDFLLTFEFLNLHTNTPHPPKKKKKFELHFVLNMKQARMDNEYSPEVDHVSRSCSNEYGLLWSQRCVEGLDLKSK